MLFLGGILVGFFLYTDYLVFLSIWAIGVLASAFIWRNARILWVERLLALPFLIALMAGPYLTPLIYGTYDKLEHTEYFEAYLGKTSDNQLSWLTAPQGSLGGGYQASPTPARHLRLHLQAARVERGQQALLRHRRIEHCWYKNLRGASVGIRP